MVQNHGDVRLALTLLWCQAGARGLGTKTSFLLHCYDAQLHIAMLLNWLKQWGKPNGKGCNCIVHFSLLHLSAFSGSPGPPEKTKLTVTSEVLALACTDAVIWGLVEEARISIPIRPGLDDGDPVHASDHCWTCETAASMQKTRAGLVVCNMTIQVKLKANLGIVHRNQMIVLVPEWPSRTRTPHKGVGSWFWPLPFGTQDDQNPRKLRTTATSNNTDRRKTRRALSSFDFRAHSSSHDEAIFWQMKNLAAMRLSAGASLIWMHFSKWELEGEMCHDVPPPRESNYCFLRLLWRQMLKFKINEALWSIITATIYAFTFSFWLLLSVHLKLPAWLELSAWGKFCHWNGGKVQDFLELKTETPKSCLFFVKNAEYLFCAWDFWSFGSFNLSFIDISEGKRRNLVLSHEGTACTILIS